MSQSLCSPKSFSSAPPYSTKLLSCFTFIMSPKQTGGALCVCGGGLWSYRPVGLMYYCCSYNPSTVSILYHLKPLFNRPLLSDGALLFISILLKSSAHLLCSHPFFFFFPFALRSPRFSLFFSPRWFHSQLGHSGVAPRFQWRFAAKVPHKVRCQMRIYSFKSDTSL